MNHGKPLRGSELRGMLGDGSLLARASVQGTHETEQPEVLTLVDVAALLRVERHHIPKLIECGLPYRRVGSMRRFLRDEVMVWLRGQKESE
jgi:excisionase family DNA binding protein